MARKLGSAFLFIAKLFALVNHFHHSVDLDIAGRVVDGLELLFNALVFVARKVRP